MKNKNYEELWNTIIFPLLDKYRNEYALAPTPETKQLIFEHYVQFRDFCKKHYMLDANNFIDRHKVCACMIYAIIKTQPLHSGDETNNKDCFNTINEKIAIAAGLSLLRAFVISSAKQNLNDDELEEIIKKFKSGIRLPQPPFINHGDYIENFAVELYFTRKYNNYNILSLAHTLYMLELYTRAQ